MGVAGDLCHFKSETEMTTSLNTFKLAKGSSLIHQWRNERKQQ